MHGIIDGEDGDVYAVDPGGSQDITWIGTDDGAGGVTITATGTDNPNDITVGRVAGFFENGAIINSHAFFAALDVNAGTISAVFDEGIAGTSHTISGQFSPNVAISMSLDGVGVVAHYRLNYRPIGGGIGK